MYTLNSIGLISRSMPEIGLCFFLTAGNIPSVPLPYGNLTEATEIKSIFYMEYLSTG